MNKKTFLMTFMVIMLVTAMLTLVACDGLLGTNANVGSVKKEKNVETPSEELADEAFEEQETEEESEKQTEQVTSADTEEQEEPEEPTPDDNEEPEEPEEPVVNEGLKMVTLGDSIAEAIYGVTPLSERDNMGYYALLGKMNGYSYSNYAHAGDTTSDLYDKVKNASGQMSTDLDEADIIVISIIGNDYLQSDYKKLAIEYVNGGRTEFDKILNQAVQNIKKTLSLIYERNSDVHIFVQTLYNPVWADHPLLTDDIKQFIESYGYKVQLVRSVARVLIDRANAGIMSILEDDPDAFTVIDVYSKFYSVANNNTAKGKELIAEDGIHPSSKGHAVIAELIQQALIDTKLMATNVDALDAYKSIRKDLLNRRYTETLNVQEVSSAIDECDTIGEVTDVYFNAVKDVAISPLVFEEMQDGNLKIVGADTALKSVVIPEKYNGKSITAIAEWAFDKSYQIQEIYIPATITTIEGPIQYGSNSLIVYCEADSEPSGWSEDWDHSYWYNTSSGWKLVTITCYWGAEMPE